MSTLRLHARTLARRIDALSLRERVILFVSAVALLAGVADALVLSPQFAQQRTMAQRMHGQNQELDTLRGRVARAAAPPTADDSPRGRALVALQRVHEEQAALTRQLDALTPAGATGALAQPDLPQLLTRVLRRHERLALLHLATVDDGAPKGAGIPAATPAPATAPAAPPRALELKLQGAYGDLLQYLLDIERAVPGQRWSTWQLTTGTGAPVLTLRLALPGESR